MVDAVERGAHELASPDPQRATMLSHRYVPREPEETQVIPGSMNMGYMSDTAKNRTHNLFRTKCKPIPLGRSDGQNYFMHFTCKTNVWL